MREERLSERSAGYEEDPGSSASSDAHTDSSSTFSASHASGYSAASPSSELSDTGLPPALGAVAAATALPASSSQLPRSATASPAPAPSARRGIGRLCSVCRAWDAALLPLLHPPVKGVISSAELRRLKRLALDQSNLSPLADHALGQGFHTEPKRPRRPGVLLPERMLYNPQFLSERGTRLTEAFIFGVVQTVADCSFLQRYQRLQLLCWLWSNSSDLDWLGAGSHGMHLRNALYRHELLNPIVIGHFSRIACVAYRILLVIKAVEARAMALDEAGRRAAGLDERELEALRTRLGNADAARVPMARSLWLDNSQPGAVADFAWSVHLESRASYARASRALLSGSRALALPPRLDSTTGCPSLIVFKARALFPLLFEHDDALASGNSFFRASLETGVSDVEAALTFGMVELLADAGASEFEPSDHDSDADIYWDYADDSSDFSEDFPLTAWLDVGGIQ